MKQRTLQGANSAAVARPAVSRYVTAMVIAFVAALLIGATPGLAHAAYVSGSVGTFSTAGVGYENYATINTSTGSAVAYTATGPSSSTVSAGWVGSRGRLFTGGGSLSCEGSNDYSSVSLVAGGYWSGNSCTRGGSGTWYSYGVSLTWNGSSYNSTYTFQSPTQNS